ncbi:MAG: hypothetical protein AB1505_11060 [Candidatus Latescibacterota bacterium]
MTPRERLEATLRGELANKVPFTAFVDKLPRGEVERRLRNGGLCLVDRYTPVHRSVTPHVEREERHRVEDGRRLVRTVYRTPHGELCEVEESGADGAGRWHVERLFKGPQDYRRLLSLADDEVYEPDYGTFLRRQETLGHDFFLRPDAGYSPMHQIVYSIMGIERFAQEWAERRDEVLRLYEALVANRRRLYPVLAASPALLVNYCGNISPEVVGLKRFEEYYLPHLNEFATLMHESGKLASVHLDAAVWLFEELIGISAIDCVEAFTPPPDGDLSVAHARSVWPDKVLWVNFPTSVHLRPVAEVEAVTRQLLREAASGLRFILGITENLPPDRWRESLPAILRVLNAHGQLSRH